MITTTTLSKDIDKFMRGLVARNPHEPLFHQAVEEVVRSVYPIVADNEAYQKHKILERLTEPERIYMFSVQWLDRNHEVRVNRGYRIQASTALGPSKGGLRFDSSVNLDKLKFLAFEQIFKNSNTGLWLGAGKGGSDFDPKDKTDFEVMSFCHAFMDKLYAHLGEDTDVPAGDIGVGLREIGYLYGHYRTLTNKNTGVLTGKDPEWGGSFLRPQATGYGLVYFVEAMLSASHHQQLQGWRVAISGSGNVAQYAAEKAIEQHAVVVSLSDRGGTIYDEGGITHDKLRWVMGLKNERRGSLREYAEKYGVPYFPKKAPWQHVRCDIALPCAMENDITREDAKALIKNGGTLLVAEGANMPTSKEAVELFREAKILFGPGKAANAGGVAVSQIEMAQDGQRTRWTEPEVDAKLQTIMSDIHKKCVHYGKDQSGYVDYVKGANIAGFMRVADAMVHQGL